MNKRHVLHVMRSEWKKTRKTPVQLVLMLLVPIVSILFLSWGLCYVRVMVNRYDGIVYLPDESTKDMISDKISEYYPDFSFRTGNTEDAEKKVHDGKADCAVVVEEKEVCILYDSSIITSSQALKDAGDCAGDIVYLLEGEDYYEDAYSLYPEIELVDSSTSTDKLVNYMDQIAGIIGMLLFLMMASNAMTIAANTITGEKERQTFDSLVLCPAPLRKILLGKELVMFLEILASGLAGILAAGAGMAIWNPDEFSMLCDISGRSGAVIPVMLILLLSAALVITGIFSIIASAFAETKKVSLFSSAGMVLVSVAAMIPSFISSRTIRYFPVANWTPLIKQLSKNKIEYAPLLTSLAIAAAVFVLGMILSCGLWERRSE